MLFCSVNIRNSVLWTYKYIASIRMYFCVFGMVYCCKMKRLLLENVQLLQYLTSFCGLCYLQKERKNERRKTMYDHDLMDPQDHAAGHSYPTVCSIPKLHAIAWLLRQLLRRRCVACNLSNILQASIFSHRFFCERREHVLQKRCRNK